MERTVSGGEGGPWTETTTPVASNHLGKEVPMTLFHRRLSLVAAAVSVGMSWIACRPPYAEEIWTLDSPAGKSHLFLERQDSEGAFGDYTYNVIASPPNAPGAILWTSTGCQPVYLFWTSETEIEIHIDLENPRCKGLTQGPSASGAGAGFRLVARPLPGRSKSDLLAE